MVEAEVDGRNVTLSGNAHSYSEIGSAGFTAWMATGVARVKNNLSVAQ